MIKLLLTIGLSTAVFSYSQEKIEKFQKNVHIQPKFKYGKVKISYKNLDNQK